MDIQIITAEMERRAEDAGVPIYTVCEQAGIAPSTFYRWKKGDSSATLTKIGAIHAQLDKIERERKSA